MSDLTELDERGWEDLVAYQFDYLEREARKRSHLLFATRYPVISTGLSKQKRESFRNQFCETLRNVGGLKALRVEAGDDETEVDGPRKTCSSLRFVSKEDQLR